MTSTLGWTGPGPSPYPSPWLEVPIFPRRECRQLGSEDKGCLWKALGNKQILTPGKEVLEAQWKHFISE